MSDIFGTYACSYRSMAQRNGFISERQVEENMGRTTKPRREIQSSPKRGSIPIEDIEKAYADMEASRDEVDFIDEMFTPDELKRHTIYTSGAECDMLNKLRMDLIPPEVDESYAEVLGLGAGKYEDRNWERGVPYMACVAKLRRHLTEWLKGNDVNSKDGNLNHLQHVQFWANALVTYMKRGRTDLDDRPSTTTKERP